MASPEASAPSPLASPGSPDGTIDLSPLTAAHAARRRKKQEEAEAELLGEGGEENVNVCIRVRPFNRRELELQRQSADQYSLRSVVEMPCGMAGKVICLERKDAEYRFVEEFQYTKTFWSIPDDQQPHPFSPVTQEDVYEAVGKPILKYAFHGFNNCVFAYGQTGSGKTHTMMGDFSLNEESAEFGEQTGLIPRLCRELFERIEKAKANIEEGIIKTFDVRLNAIEIYNEQVRDLFWRNTPGRSKGTVLKVRMHPTEGAFVDQLSVLNPTSWRDCLKKIEKGVSERTVAATLMNDESSRSHSVFQIIMTQTETVHIRSDDPDDRYSKPVTYKKVSKINLVDLAGSERLKKSGAQGQQLKEAANINQSLTTLKKVIDALVTNSKEPNAKKHVLIPFRESTLTLLLSDSLGGNSKTTMIACVSPHFDNQEETLLTLRYANRTGAIVNNTRINEDTAAKQALALKHHILELQKRLAEGPIDEEAEELLDQIEVGRQSLRELEEANKKAELLALDMKTKAKQEEGARFANAFYNTLKMAMLLQQKEQLDSQVHELETGLNSTREETAVLRNNVKTTTINEIQYSRDIEKMTLEDRRKEERDAIMDLQTKKLLEENETTKRKYEREVELRYAQKLVNARKARQMRVKVEQELTSLQKECDEKLTKVIMDAAEQYELQVREFADNETNQQHKIARLEKEISKISKEREQCEQESSSFMADIRENEKSHSARMSAIESEWKEKYEVMKADYQKRIDAFEQELFDEARRRDVEKDEQSIKENAAHREAVSRIEEEIIKKESAWKLKISMSFDSHGDKLHDVIRKQEENSRLKAIVTRRECEKRIGELYGRLERVKYMEQSHEASLLQLQRILQTMANTHDKLMEPPPADCSLELLQLKQKLKRFEGELASSPLRIGRVSEENSPERNGKMLTYDGASGAAGATSNHSAAARNSIPSPQSVTYTTINTPVKAFNVFSQEKFASVNSRRFDGPCHKTAAAARNITSLDISKAAKMSSPNFTSTTPRRQLTVPSLTSPSVFSGLDASVNSNNASTIQRKVSSFTTPSSATPSAQLPSSTGKALFTDPNAKPPKVHRIVVPQDIAPVKKTATTPRTSSGLRSVPLRK